MNKMANISMIEAVSADLRKMLGDDFDPATFWDTLDGETDTADLVGHLIKARALAQANEVAIKEVALTFMVRAKRMAAQGAACRFAIGQILDAAGEVKYSHPLATISRTKPRESVDIYAADDVPSQLTVTTTRPDAAAIKKQLEAGVSVPGAELVTGDAGLTIRIK